MKVGLVNNVVTFAANFGKQTEIYNGVDVNFVARLPRGGQVSSGVNVGNSINGGGLGGPRGAHRAGL